MPLVLLRIVNVALAAGYRAAVGRRIGAPGLVGLLTLLLATTCQAQNGRGQRELSSINASTRWTLRALSPVTVTSPIIRLGDVVQPLNPNLAGWPRLRGSVIGLMPLGGQPMTIQRDRLAAAIIDAEATPRMLEWLGPTAIKVKYRPELAGQVQQIQQTKFQVEAIPAKTVQRKTEPVVDPLLKIEADRILRWIRLAIEREYPSIATSYQIEIDRKQPSLVALKTIGGVTSIELPESVTEGRCQLHVVARTVDGPLEADIVATLTTNPTIAVTRKGLPRGHRIGAGDLTLMPIPAEQIDPEFVVDPDEVIGLEVRSALRPNRPIERDDLGSPILVHRGDLIEIRVVGGGITITTNAKALADGAESELIEIETMQPRKRLLARVVQTGLVEIVTRPPGVKE